MSPAGHRTTRPVPHMVLAWTRSLRCRKGRKLGAQVGRSTSQKVKVQKVISENNEAKCLSSSHALTQPKMDMIEEEASQGARECAVEL